MKIGVLTFHKTLNYGAILQAYALCEYLKSTTGNTVELIDYECKAVKKREYPQSLGDISGAKQKLLYCLGKTKRKSKQGAFEKFEKKYLNISENKYDSKGLSLCSEYDVVICGSDQIWNGVLTENDKEYFLSSFPEHVRKYSYAASFGYEHVPNDFYDETVKGLQGLKCISVREKAGIEIVKNLIGCDAELVVDPTLLLNTNEWKNRIKNNSEQNYIVVYLPHNKKEVFSFAKRLAKKTNAVIKYINITNIPMPGMENYYYLSPIEFMEMINSARYVVTGSFHGVAFSINLHKQFYYECSAQSAVSGSRVQSLVEAVGLEARMITDVYDENAIDYAQVDLRLEVLREKSIKYLAAILGEKEEN